jgi:5-methylcytosine-specific restriction enzyme subunit McrC
VDDEMIVPGGTLELTEYVRASFPEEAIPATAGEILWREHGEKIGVEFPSPKSGGRWRLTSLGWVGILPVTPELRLVLRPKVALRNLFGMLEYAYRLRSFRFLDGTFACSTIEEFYAELAAILARRVLDRAHRGLYMNYISESDRLPYLRGSLDFRRSLRFAGSPDLDCDYQESTADNEENRIIAWTLHLIARSGTCGERALQLVRRASHALQGSVALRRCDPASCTGRIYTRLNDDYHQLHALCRFFLEQSGPTHEAGERTMIPFVVDMTKLFELFVAEWLLAHLPEGARLTMQETVTFGGPFHFQIDIVLYDTEGLPLSVIDTKYKAPSAPSADDVAQVVAYAEAKGCRDAVLLYPTALASPIDLFVGDVRVRSLHFPLDGDLDAAGRTLLERLMEQSPSRK